MRKPESGMEQVTAAIERAHYAVEADTDGDFETAIAYYREAVSLIKNEMDNLPEHRDVLEKYSETYLNRVHILEGELEKITREEYHDGNDPYGNSAVIKARAKNTSFPVNFSEEAPADALPPDPPVGSIANRSFWLMNVLAKSMTSGGYLTPRLYVPNYIWYQDHVKLPAVNVKVASCESILEGLTRLRQANSEEPISLQRELEAFCSTTIAVQNDLSKSLSFIPKTKEEKKDSKNTFSLSKIGKTLGKGVARLGDKGTSADNARYIQLLIAIFENSQYLESWLNSIKSTGPLLESLERISDFFYSVVCAFVFRDLTVLLERYMRQARKSFSRLYPK